MADEGIYMYQQSASSAVESTNAANKEMRARMAVDALNATLLLIRLECNRFQRMKQEAWGDNLGLTPRRKDEYDSTYTDLFCTPLQLQCHRRQNALASESTA
jgi:hypothetical protein